MTTNDNAGVHFPPPFLFIIAMILGFGAQSFRPITLVPSALAIPLGLVILAMSFGLAAWSIREFRRNQTALRPNLPASSIVRTGPFAYSRNPIYIAASLLQLGVAVTTNNLWTALMLVPVLVIVRTQIIAREEAYLERAFGADYVDYKKAVRRWI